MIKDLKLEEQTMIHAIRDKLIKFIKHVNMLGVNMQIKIYSNNAHNDLM